jgi:5-methylcytosine-specific restriction endonuclease McrA
MLGSRVRSIDLAIAHPDKRADPFYLSAAWKETRARILARDGYRCAIDGCERPATVVDHIVARRSGGSDADANLRSLCRTHDNTQKENHLGVRRRSTDLYG